MEPQFCSYYWQDVHVPTGKLESDGTIDAIHIGECKSRLPHVVSRMDECFRGGAASKKREPAPSM